ncbi:MAG TPA: enoyl-CoA hydratase [Lichenihabitans sp.]|jgi:acyl dehydratase|nr:enoyl-CoA hydratase [Lichenihabitans sp.]
MTPLFFEDFTAGQSLPDARTTVTAGDAARFAASFGVLAPPGCEADADAVSGFHVAALCMRLIFDAFLRRTAGLGAPGVEVVDWPHPVVVGDRLRLRSEVKATRPSQSRPGMGLVTFDFALFNQHGDCVMTQSNVILVRRRTPQGGA